MEHSGHTLKALEVSLCYYLGEAPTQVDNAKALIKESDEFIQFKLNRVLGEYI